MRKYRDETLAAPFDQRLFAKIIETDGKYLYVDVAFSGVGEQKSYISVNTMRWPSYNKSSLNNVLSEEDSYRIGHALQDKYQPQLAEEIIRREQEKEKYGLAVVSDEEFNLRKLLGMLPETAGKDVP